MRISEAIDFFEKLGPKLVVSEPRQVLEVILVGAGPHECDAAPLRCGEELIDGSPDTVLGAVLAASHFQTLVQIGSGVYWLTILPHELEREVSCHVDEAETRGELVGVGLLLRGHANVLCDGCDETQVV